MAKAPAAPAARALNRAALCRWPLPALDAEGDKNARGKVVIVAGSNEIPGAAVLAAEAALRVGAGKLQIATPASVAPMLAIAVPEARVIALSETRAGGLTPKAVEQLEAIAPRTDAVLFGPGMLSTRSTKGCIDAALLFFAGAITVLDAAALPSLHRVDGQRLVLTPHGGEMAQLLDMEREEVEQQAASLCQRYAQEWGAALLLKGATSWLGAPDGRLWKHKAPNAGLAMSGSGDVLAGLVAGLAARGADAEQALAWGVVLHAGAGKCLGQAVGPVGYLARELSREFPALLRELQQKGC